MIEERGSVHLVVRSDIKQDNHLLPSNLISF